MPRSAVFKMSGKTRGVENWGCENLLAQPVDAMTQGIAGRWHERLRERHSRPCRLQPIQAIQHSSAGRPLGEPGTVRQPASAPVPPSTKLRLLLFHRCKGTGRGQCPPGCRRPDSPRVELGPSRIRRPGSMPWSEKRSYDVLPADTSDKLLGLQKESAIRNRGKDLRPERTRPGRSSWSRLLKQPKVTYPLPSAGRRPTFTGTLGGVKHSRVSGRRQMVSVKLISSLSGKVHGSAIR